ncbi:MAG TPA: FixH family protein [Gammaproteobacteria bacterium]|nr:FixH family protein [Gammaproteobacteria bacterium]
MNPLLSVPLGVVAQVVVFLSLYRFTRLTGRTVAVIVGVLSLAIYFPDAIIESHTGDVMAMHVATYLVVVFFMGLITNHREQRRAEGAPGGVHWAPAAIIAFFGVIILLDTVFVTIALQGLPDSWTRYVLPAPSEPGEVRSEFPGVVPHDLRADDHQYNAYLAQYRRQQKRGWQVHKGWLSTPRARHPAPFQVTVADRSGQPVSGARVQVIFRRPSNSGDDRRFALEELSPGTYRASIRLPDPGVWDVLLRVRRGEDLHELQATTSVREYNGAVPMESVAGTG